MASHPNPKKAHASTERRGTAAGVWSSGRMSEASLNRRGVWRMLFGPGSLKSG
jgi:hypothetical protein